MEIEFENYTDSLFRFALSLSRDFHIAEDLLQECLFKAHRARNQLKQQQSKKSWLFQIMFNLWRDQSKRNKKYIHQREPIDDQVELISREPAPDQRALANEASDHVLVLMQSLPERQRTVLFLSAVERLSHNQIADMLEITRDSVKVNLSQARKQMRQKIKATSQTNP